MPEHAGGAVGDDSHDDTERDPDDDRQRDRQQLAGAHPGRRIQGHQPADRRLRDPGREGLPADFRRRDDRRARSARGRCCRSCAPAGRRRARPAAFTSRSRGRSTSWPIRPAGPRDADLRLQQRRDGARRLDDGAVHRRRHDHHRADRRGTYATPVSAIGSGTITIPAPGLPGAAGSSAEVSRPSYPFMLGTYDFADAHNSAKIDHLLVNNASTAAGAGGCQFNYVLDSDIYRRLRFGRRRRGPGARSRRSFRGSAAPAPPPAPAAPGWCSKTATTSRTPFSRSTSKSRRPACRSPSAHDGQNTFISPYFNCTTAVSATASTRNVLINPNFGGAVINRGPQSTGDPGDRHRQPGAVAVPERRELHRRPAIDRRHRALELQRARRLAGGHAAGARRGRAGWSMGFATDNGKGMTVTAPSGSASSRRQVAVVASRSAPAITSISSWSIDGSNFRVRDRDPQHPDRATGSRRRDWPGNWLYPSTGGYAATLADNGNVLSSFNTERRPHRDPAADDGAVARLVDGVCDRQRQGADDQGQRHRGGNILWPARDGVGRRR